MLSDRGMLVNGPAAGLLAASDQGVLWHTLAVRSSDPVEVSLSSGRSVVIRSEEIVDAGQVVGALVHVNSTGQTNPGDADPHGPSRSVHGWSSLSGTERTVAGLVAEGLTNREAAVRLFLSPHTVDFHLRHIFGKLDVRSRVELTRVVLEREAIALHG